MASSQYSSGPGSKAPWASRVACPTSGPCPVSTLHDRSAIAASSPTGRQPSRASRAAPDEKGAPMPAREGAAARRPRFREAFFGSGPL